METLLLASIPISLFIVFIIWLGVSAPMTGEPEAAAIKDKYAPPEAKPAAAKPPPPPDTPRIAALMAMVSELEAAIKARENCIEHLTAETKRLQAALRRKEEASAKVSALEAAIERKNKLIEDLNSTVRRKDDKIAELQRSPRQTMTRAQYRNLQFCLHPDRVASAHNEELTARYTQAFRWLADTAQSSSHT
jgi:hypothetical protein